VANLGFSVYVKLAYPITQSTLFADARLYRLASLAWLEGRDPWGNLGMHAYAAPPPTLLFMAPFALVPEELAIPVFEALAVAGVVWAIRYYRLPWVFLIWPPLVDNILVGNPNALLLPLLASVAPVAVLAKAYAIVPLWGRWRMILLSVALLIGTIPILPWGLYVSEFAAINGRQADQAEALSSWGTALFPLVVVALWSLGANTAKWLAVPTLWPLTQLGYNVLALPVARTPLVALGLSVPVPLVGPIAVIAFAIQHRLLARRDGTPRPGPDPG